MPPPFCARQPLASSMSTTSGPAGSFRSKARLGVTSPPALSPAELLGDGIAGMPALRLSLLAFISSSKIEPCSESCEMKKEALLPESRELDDCGEPRGVLAWEDCPRIEGIQAETIARRV